LYGWGLLLYVGIQFSQHHLLKKQSSLQCHFLVLCWESLAVSEWPYIWILCSILLVQVCFCASAMLFLLLWLCSMILSWVLWYFQHWSFCSGLFWLFGIFCDSVWILGLTFLLIWWMSWAFWWKLPWVYRAHSIE
jgi:hypothetical protein